MGVWLTGACVRTSAFIACVVLSAPLDAADDVTFAPETDQVATTELSLASPSVAFPYRIANTGQAELVATLNVKVVTRSDGGICGDGTTDGCRLSWQLGSTLLTPGVDRPIHLNPGKSLTLILAGEVPSLATYVAEATLTPSGKDPIPVSLRITRKLADFGTAPIIARDGSRFNSIFGGTIPVGVINNAALPVDLTGPPVVRLFRDEGDGKFSTLAQPGGFCVKSIDPNAPTAKPTDPKTATKGPATVTRLAPGARYDCEAVVPPLSPGKYRAEIDLPQANLPNPRPAAEFTVRWPGMIAIVLLIIGAMLGAFIADWQASGRRRTIQASMALDLRAKIRAWLAPLKPDENPSSIDIGKSMIIDLNADISNLQTVPEADFDTSLATITSRFPILIRFAALEKEFVARGGKPDQTEFVAARIAVQQGNADANEKLTELEKSLPPVKGFVASLAANHPVVSEHWTTLKDGAALRRRIRLVERGLLVVSIIIAVLVGYQGLYAGNPIWGGAGDVLIALLTGIGATISGALTLTSITSKYLLPQLGERR